jgi:hypothetical protein
MEQSLIRTGSATKVQNGLQPRSAVRLLSLLRTARLQIYSVTEFLLENVSGLHMGEKKLIFSRV